MVECGAVSQPNSDLFRPSTIILASLVLVYSILAVVICVSYLLSPPSIMGHLNRLMRILMATIDDMIGGMWSYQPSHIISFTRMQHCVCTRNLSGQSMHFVAITPEYSKPLEAAHVHIDDD